jgi:hypothetical protein
LQDNEVVLLTVYKGPFPGGQKRQLPAKTGEKSAFAFTIVIFAHTA